MLRGIDPLIGPELLFMLARAGHGDALALVDRNYPAYSSGPPVVRLDGVDCTQAAEAILTLLPLDDFVATPLQAMSSHMTQQPVSHAEVAEVSSRAAQRRIVPELLERKSFYRAAASAAGVVVTSDDRPYSCFLLTKGVL